MISFHITFLLFMITLLCLPSPIIVINKSLLLNVLARFCVSLIGLARCVLRDSEGKLFIWSSAALVTPLGYAGSESLPATRIGQSRPRVWFPGS